MAESNYVVVLNGTYGVGKSSVLDHLGDLLAARRRPFSLLDVDWFHRSWPPADDDPENGEAEAKNLAAVWACYRSTGLRQPILSGVVTTASDRARYERAFALPLRSIRLEASPEVVEARLRARYVDNRPSALSWHLERYVALARRLKRADQDEIVVQTDDLTALSVAGRVLTHFGLN